MNAPPEQFVRIRVPLGTNIEEYLSAVLGVDCKVTVLSRRFVQTLEPVVQPRVVSCWIYPPPPPRLLLSQPSIPMVTESPPARKALWPAVLGGTLLAVAFVLAIYMSRDPCKDIDECTTNVNLLALDKESTLAHLGDRYDLCQQLMKHYHARPCTTEDRSLPIIFVLCLCSGGILLVV